MAYNQYPCTNKQCVVFDKYFVKLILEILLVSSPWNPKSIVCSNGKQINCHAYKRGNRVIKGQKNATNISCDAKHFAEKNEVVSYRPSDGKIRQEVNSSNPRRMFNENTVNYGWDQKYFLILIMDSVRFLLQLIKDNIDLFWRPPSPSSFTSNGTCGGRSYTWWRSPSLLARGMTGFCWCFIAVPLNTKSRAYTIVNSNSFLDFPGIR